MIFTASLFLAFSLEAAYIIFSLLLVVSSIVVLSSVAYNPFRKWQKRSKYYNQKLHQQIQNPNESSTIMDKIEDFSEKISDAFSGFEAEIVKDVWEETKRNIKDSSKRRR